MPFSFGVPYGYRSASSAAPPGRACQPHPCAGADGPLSDSPRRPWRTGGLPCPSTAPACLTGPRGSSWARPGASHHRRRSRSQPCPLGAWADGPARSLDAICDRRHGRGRQRARPGAAPRSRPHPSRHVEAPPDSGADASTKAPGQGPPCAGARWVRPCLGRTCSRTAGRCLWTAIPFPRHAPDWMRGAGRCVEGARSARRRSRSVIALMAGRCPDGLAAASIRVATVPDGVRGMDRAAVCPW